MTRADSADLADEVSVPFPFLPPEASVKQEELPHRRGAGFRQVCEELSSQSKPCRQGQPQPLDISQYPAGSFHGMSLMSTASINHELHSSPEPQPVLVRAAGEHAPLHHSVKCGVGTDNTAGTRASTCHVQPRTGGQQTDAMGLQGKTSSALGETAGLPERPRPLTFPPAACGSHCFPVFAPTFITVWSSEFQQHGDYSAHLPSFHLQVCDGAAV